MFEPVETPAPPRTSAAERAMRAAVVARLRVLLPDARIIHELVCEPNRADIAAVQPERITLFELKSEKDVLDRCEKQMGTFSKYGHEAVLVADQKWFDRTPYDNGRPRCVWPDDAYKPYRIWHFPEPEAGHPATWYNWRLKEPCLAQPAPRMLLHLLWRAELVAECFHHGMAATRKNTMLNMIDRMAWELTGAQIVRAVCRQLRARRFPEADPPICHDANGPTPAEATKARLEDGASSK